MKEQLNQLNTEVAAITAEIEAAYAAYESAAAATTRAVIALAGASDDKTLELLHDAANKEEKRALGRYEDLKKDQKCLNSMRAWLQANLRGAGERSPLPACCTMSVLSFPDMDRAQSEARSPATGQRALTPDRCRRHF